MRHYSSLAEVHSPVLRIQVAGEGSTTWGLASLLCRREALRMDSPPASIPDLTIVVL